MHAKSNYSNLVCQSKPISVLNKNRIQHTFEFSYCKTRSDNSRSLKSISSPAEYEQVAEETLQSLSDRFEEVLEDSNLIDWDVTYSNDVLTISLNNHGVYVINKQGPNKQIWLSSPFSGPKRYDFKDGLWIYKHEGISLHQLLSDEISKVIHKEADFTTCSYADIKE
ncbi:Frataxin, mitochondrial [Araneus ventricosus]|uniref:ferroxidase n=1 Tax=Araneus ventricosus TaxID=182803 RepID=A0A4Y2QES0_ARAVE|nr:Frataxin, mitochondrial [Araneus ventricosus]